MLQVRKKERGFDTNNVWGLSLVLYYLNFEWLTNVRKDPPDLSQTCDNDTR